MRNTVGLLALCGALMVGAQAQAADDEWKSDEPTCSGVYGALADRKDSLTTAFPAIAASNIGQIDYTARKTRLMTRVEAWAVTSVDLYQQAFTMRMLEDVINGGAKGTSMVPELSQRCDAAHGFTPAFALKPAPAPVPKPAPPPPAPRVAPPVASTLTDQQCAIAYYALAMGIPEDPKGQQAMLQRANGAGGEHVRNTKATDRAAVAKDIEAKAQARVKQIIATKTGLEALFADVRRCDVKYGLDMTPMPPGVKGR